MKIKRNSPGCYTASQGELVVEIFYNEPCKGWMAAAQWDRYLYTDIVDTYRDAKRGAHRMIEAQIKDEIARVEKIRLAIVAKLEEVA